MKNSAGTSRLADYKIIKDVVIRMIMDIIMEVRLKPGANIPINVRRGINSNYMPWSLNETQSMINDIKVSSYGLFGE